MFLSCISVLCGALPDCFLLGNHAAFDFQSMDLFFRVGADGDVFLKFPGAPSLAVVCYFDFPAFARLDGLFGIDGHGASAGGYGLMDDQHAFSRVGELEDAGHRAVRFFERTKIMFCLFKRHLGFVVVFALCPQRGGGKDEER